MITANELRISNLIFIFDRFNKRNDIERIASITNDEIGLQSHFIDLIGHKDEYEVKRKIKVEDAIPIPLTPEILKKLGLKKEGVTFKCKVGKYILWWKGTSQNDYVFMLHDIRDDENVDDFSVYSIPIATINVLHQLQNLYFDLTGEELSIDMNVKVSDTTKA